LQPLAERQRTARHWLDRARRVNNRVFEVSEFEALTRLEVASRDTSHSCAKVGDLGKLRNEDASRDKKTHRESGGYEAIIQDRATVLHETYATAHWSQQ
jgi:hypothetical protein